MQTHIFKLMVRSLNIFTNVRIFMFLIICDTCRVSATGILKLLLQSHSFFIFFLIKMDILDFLSQCTLQHTTFKTAIQTVWAHDVDG